MYTTSFKIGTWKSFKKVQHEMLTVQHFITITKTHLRLYYFTNLEQLFSYPFCQYLAVKEK